MISDPRSLLRELFDSAVARADPARVIADHLPAPPIGRTIVVGCGKATAAMAAAFEDAWDGDVEGLVVTRYGHAVPTRSIEVVEAAHPTPDEAGVDATRRILGLVDGADENDLVICLVSGGGSALLVQPAEGITLADKQAVTKSLLACGATIHEINAVRKHLSAVKGGRLATRAQPARIVTLAISDVPGDDPDVIASGPTVPDGSTLADARAILEKYGIHPPVSVARHLRQEASETPKPGSAAFRNAEYHLIATPGDMLDAVAARAAEAGIAAHILSDRIEGEAREVAKVLGAMALEVAARGRPFTMPCVLLSGGETTVRVTDGGRGGRNGEFLLSLAVTLDGADAVWAIACDTDGIDGTEENAGAILTPDTLARARHASLHAPDHLARNTSYDFFAGLDDLIVTGPTRTNVNDFRAILVLPADSQGS